MRNELKKYILLNAGMKTRKAFAAGLTEGVCTQYMTKKILLHIKPDKSPVFMYGDNPIDWTDSYIFTRLSGSDRQFSGILYDYFTYHNILASDPINHSYVNSAAKISQMLLLAIHGIQIPETFIFREESYAFNRSYLEKHISFPCIYKTDGSSGRNVHYAKTIEELSTLVAQKKPRVLALVQPFIENSFDTRTIVAFNEIIGAIKRTRSEGHLNNIARGATASLYILSERECEIAKNAAYICGIDVAGVDMIHTESGPIVLEVNKSPQIRGFESVHDIKVFSKIAEILQKKIVR